MSPACHVGKKFIHVYFTLTNPIKTQVLKRLFFLPLPGVVVIFPL